MQNTGAADTIIERLAPADTGGVPGTDTIPIELVALSLVSVNPINVGSGAELLKATLGSDLGSTMDITFDDMNGGTFSSTLSFEVKFTGLTSGTMIEVPKTFTSADNPWQRSPTGSVVLDGVNHLLKGDSTEDQNFWPIGLMVHDDGSGTVHIVEPVLVPEPATLILLALGLAGIGVRRRQTH